MKQQIYFRQKLEENIKVCFKKIRISNKQNKEIVILHQYKLKGNKSDFNSYRGIFRVPIFRTILDRLIYNDQYEVIDEALSDSNVGARKNRNVRDNIFVLNAITNSVINGNSEPIDIQVFDIEKCFDALWVQ